MVFVGGVVNMSVAGVRVVEFGTKSVRLCLSFLLTVVSFVSYFERKSYVDDDDDDDVGDR